MNPERCQAVAKSGNPCTAVVQPGRPYCLWHDPEADEQRAEIARKGGAARSIQARAAKELREALTADALAAALSVAFMRVLAGKTEPKVGTAAATMAKAILECRDVADRPRIEALEEQAERFKAAIEGTIIREGGS